MNKIICLLLALVACKANPPPVVEGKCHALAYNSDGDARHQYCAYQGFWWDCYLDKRTFSCTRKEQLPAEGQ